MSNDGKKEARVLDHEYDGIQEFDNPQPAYWTWIFLGSTVWALGYFIYYHLGGPGKSDTEQYAAEWAVYDTQRKATEERCRKLGLTYVFAPTELGLEQVMHRALPGGRVVEHRIGGLR